MTCPSQPLPSQLGQRLLDKGTIVLWPKQCIPSGPLASTSNSQAPKNLTGTFRGTNNPQQAYHHLNKHHVVHLLGRSWGLGLPAVTGVGVEDGASDQLK